MERAARRSSASVASGTKRLSCARRRNRPTSPPVAAAMASANIRTIRRARFGFFLSMEAEPLNLPSRRAPSPDPPPRDHCHMTSIGFGLTADPSAGRACSVGKARLIDGAAFAL